MTPYDINKNLIVWKDLKFENLFTPEMYLQKKNNQHARLENTLFSKFEINIIDFLKTWFFSNHIQILILFSRK